MKLNEKELIKQLQIGDTNAYKYLFTEYYDWLCNYVYKLCGNKSIAEDIVQEALIKFWEKRKSIKISSSVKNYLFRTCYNQFLQHVKSKKVQFDRLDKIQWEAISEDSLESDVNDIRIEKLNSLIDQLPLRCRQIFVQNKFDKRKYKEIAIDMGISIKTVENQMSKALHFLRENAVMLISFSFLL